MGSFTESKEVRDVYLERGYKVTLNDVLEAMQASNLDGEEMLSLQDFLTQGSIEVYLYHQPASSFEIVNVKL